MYLKDIPAREKHRRGQKALGEKCQRPTKFEVFLEPRGELGLEPGRNASRKSRDLTPFGSFPSEMSRPSSRK